MRVGIYNRYWTTKGGGEQNAASYASVLSKLYSVELVGVEDFDVGQLAQALGQPALRDIPLRVIGTHPTAATEASRDYDLWICHSYLSDDHSLARYGIYVVMFPQEIQIPNNRDTKFVDDSSSHSQIDENFFDRTVMRHEDSVNIHNKKKNRLTFISSGTDGRIDLLDSKTNRIIETSLTTRDRLIHTFNLPKGKVTLRFLASGESEDSRCLNVESLRLADGSRIPKKVKAVTKPRIPTFTLSYNMILSISSYTSTFVKQRWGVDSRIHYPAVDLKKSGSAVLEKDKIILCVGRFFSEEHGHSKQQLQLVEIFKKMVAAGLEGWRLTLIGGCDANNREYAMAVKKAAIGSPIDVILNADSETLSSFMNRASIYWHATGLRMNLDSNPEKAEHFGIAPVEAMSAGCIPILFGVGGTAELVEENVSGFTFLNEEDLINKTLEIINADDEKKNQIRNASIKRAEMFSQKRFETELMSLLQELKIEENSDIDDSK